MEIHRLPAGQLAPEDSDCVHVSKTADGKYELNCSVLLACGEGDEVESVALIGGRAYDSFEQAEAAGLAWAADQCVETLYVSTSG
jgi:hypothetical protein